MPQIDSLIRIAEAGKRPPTPAAGASSSPGAPSFVDAEMSSTGPAPATDPSGGFSAASGGISGGGVAAVAADVRTVPGLVSLTIDCLEDGLSDEATILQRHFKSPDFGHPLLRLASPSDNDPDHPHVPDDPEVRSESCFFFFCPSFPPNICLSSACRPVYILSCLWMSAYLRV